MSDGDVRSRLLALSAQRGVSLAALSDLIGRNASYLQQFVRKGSPRKLEEGDRRILARFLGVDEVELGAPAREDAALAQVLASKRLPLGQPLGNSVQDSARRSGAVRPMPDWLDVPRLGLGASAGQGAIAEHEEAVGQLRFSARWLKQQGLDPAALTVIALEGDSMEPVLRDGDEILVDRTPRALRAGIYVIRLDDVLLVKRLEPGPAGRVAIISDNPAYGRSECQFGDVEIIGRVVWKGGRL